MSMTLKNNIYKKMNTLIDISFVYEKYTRTYTNVLDKCKFASENMYLLKLNRA